MVMLVPVILVISVLWTTSQALGHTLSGDGPLSSQEALAKLSNEQQSEKEKGACLWNVGKLLEEPSKIQNQALSAIEKGLQESSVNVRSCLFQIVVRLAPKWEKLSKGLERIRPYLTKQLQSKDEFGMGMASYILYRILPIHSADTIHVTTQLLASASTKTKTVILEGLSGRKSIAEEYTRTLLSRARDSSEDREVRRKAILLLPKLDKSDKEIHSDLKTLLRDSDPMIRLAAVDVMSSVGLPNEIGTLLSVYGQLLTQTDGSQLHAVFVLDSLGRLGRGAAPLAPVLVALLKDLRNQSDVVIRVVSVLQKADVPLQTVATQAIAWCDDKNPEVRLAGLRALTLVQPVNRQMLRAAEKLSADSDRRVASIASKVVQEIQTRLTDIEWKISVPEISVTGALPEMVVRSFSTRYHRELFECFQSSGLNGEAAAIELVFAFEIRSSGKVVSESIKIRSETNKLLSDCVSNSLMKWNFPMSNDGETVTTVSKVVLRFSSVSRQ